MCSLPQTMAPQQFFLSVSFPTSKFYFPSKYIKFHFCCSSCSSESVYCKKSNKITCTSLSPDSAIPFYPLSIQSTYDLSCFPILCIFHNLIFDPVPQIILEIQHASWTRLAPTNLLFQFSSHLLQKGFPDQPVLGPSCVYSPTQHIKTMYLNCLSPPQHFNHLKCKDQLTHHKTPALGKLYRIQQLLS